MREKTVCRLCGLKSERKSFAIVGSQVHYAPDRPFRLEHIFLDLIVDPRAKILRGQAIQRIRVVSPEQRWLRLDQMNLRIHGVSVGRWDPARGEPGKTEKKKADFAVGGHLLRIDLDSVSERSQPDQVYEVSVDYEIDHPQRGIYFTGPDEHYPHKPFQVWTQGQDEDSRHWIPTLDYPCQKATSEIRVVVPEGFTAVSNGELLSQKKVSGSSTEFHYRLGTPHVTYLISLVVAEFDAWSDEGPRGLPVQYFVARGRKEEGQRAFGKTPQMIQAFEEKTGVAYPFEKYSQVAVQDFIFGGMENTSATTQTELVLHDARAHLDFSADPLVSHELAHQWFGDLVTCRDWSHGWLNEGFATFMERVWVEADPELNPSVRWEEAKYGSYQDFKEYLAEDQGSYRRPIVCNTYIEPIDLFDRHLYQKGGLVLNLIRSILGDQLFWKSVHLYLSRHRGGSVETIDWVRAIEDATGKNLRRFFDEWVYGAGHPEFELTYTWHEEKKQAEWVIEQKQTQGAPSVTQNGATTHLFHLPVMIEMTLEGGKVLSHQIEIGEARERIFLSTPSRPLMARFDPHGTIPKTLKFPRPKEMLLFQLKQDPDCMGRIEAARELMKCADRKIEEALGQALLEDSFWGVQVEIAEVLSELRTASSRDALIRGLQVQHPKARRAVVQALGSYSDSIAAAELKKFAIHDESYFVEAEATLAWSKASLSLSLNSQTQEVEKFLIDQLSKESYREVIRSSTLNALAELPGIGSGEQMRALQLMIQWTECGKSMDARSAAVRALGKVLKKAGAPVKSRILQVLDSLADEDHFRLRMQLMHSLLESECVETIPILQKMELLDRDGRVKRGAKNAIDSLMTSKPLPESVTQLKGALQKLEEDYRKLRAQVEESVLRV